MDRNNIDIETLTRDLMEWRNFLSKVWTPETAYPKTDKLSIEKTNSAGQCVVSSFILINRLSDIKYASPRLMLGKVEYTNSTTAIPYHGWIEIGDKNPLIIDITPDQALECNTKIIVSNKTNTKEFGLIYKGIKQITISEEKKKEIWTRYLILFKNLLNRTDSKKFLGLGVGLDLIEIDDNDVTKYVEICLKKAIGNDAKIFLSLLLKLSYDQSFSNTRTYPRPDHPEKIKRRSPTFTLVAIITSFRTTLENEQKAVNNLLDNYRNDEELLLSKTEDLEKHLYSAGMAKKKAISIKKALHFISENYNFGWSKFNKMDRFKARDKLLEIPGIGEKGADCLLSVGLGRAATTIDTNVFRVASRFFNSPYIDNLDYNNSKQMSFVREKLSSIIGDDPFLSQISHTLLLLHGKHICKARCASESIKSPKYCHVCQIKHKSS